MTVSEAIKQTQGKRAGLVNQASARYADTLLLPEECVIAAVVANIATSKESFPGVVVLTDRRVMAVCGLPGIKRAIVLKLDELKKCEETNSVLNYKAAFFGEKDRFSLTVSPDVGEKFSRCIAVLNGEAEVFDSVKLDVKSGLFNPTLARNRLRKRQAKEREQERQLEAREAARLQTEPSQDVDTSADQKDAKTVAALLNQQLKQARARETISETDPRAVAARLAAELAAEEENKL